MTHFTKCWFSWVKQLWSGPGRPLAGGGRLCPGCNWKPLEDRTVPATIIVTGIGDNMAVDQQVTLREAITSINNGADIDADVTAKRIGAYGANDTIIFNIGNGNQPIAIQTFMLPVIKKTVVIDGTPPPNSTQTIELNGGESAKWGRTRCSRGQRQSGVRPHGGWVSRQRHRAEQHGERCALGRATAC